MMQSPLAFSARFAVVACVLLAFLVYEKVWLGLSLLATSRPSTGPYFELRTLVAFLLSAWLVAGLFRRRDTHKRLGWHLFAGARRAAAAGSLALAIAFVAVFMLDPGLFRKLAAEDGVVEWTSALLPLLASLVFARAARMVWRAQGRGGAYWFSLVAACGLSAVLFLMAMEEISWFQRVFDVPTPDLFAGNSQNETNLHNFASNPIGTAHKLVGFAALILLPFIRDVLPKHLTGNVLFDFVPSRFVVALSAPLAGFNYNVWNFMPIQMMMFMTVLILLCYAWMRVLRAKGETFIFLGAALVVTVSQVLFLAFGDHFVRLWDVTEFQEFFIALGLLALAMEGSSRLQERYAMAPSLHGPTTLVA
jgi:hypothetical protein